MKISFTQIERDTLFKLFTHVTGRLSGDSKKTFKRLTNKFYGKAEFTEMKFREAILLLPIIAQAIKQAEGTLIPEEAKTALQTSGERISTHLSQDKINEADILC